MASTRHLSVRRLGTNGPEIPRLGLGLMVTSGIYGTPAPDADRFAFLDAAFKMGETFWDTGKLRRHALLDHCCNSIGPVQQS